MDMESIFDGDQMAGEGGGMGEEVRGLRSTNRKLQNSYGDIKYNIGNGIENLHITYEHE